MSFDAISFSVAKKHALRHGAGKGDTIEANALEPQPLSVLAYYSHDTDESTTSTNWTSFGASPNFSFNVPRDGNALIILDATVKNNTAGKFVSFRVKLDGAALKNVGGSGEAGIVTIHTANYPQSGIVILHREAGLTSGSHNINLEWFVNGGTGKCECATNNWDYLSVAVFFLG